MNQAQREHIAEELMMNSPQETLNAHQEIANMIGAGAELDEVLAATDRHGLADTYAWLKGQFAELETENTFDQEAFDREQEEYLAFLAAHPEYK